MKDEKQIQTMRSQRLLAELSFAQLSEETGITTYTLRRAEKEPQRVQVSVLQTIARYFNIPTSRMFQID